MWVCFYIVFNVPPLSYNFSIHFLALVCLSVVEYLRIPACLLGSLSICSVNRSHCNLLQSLTLLRRWLAGRMMCCVCSCYFENVDDDILQILVLNGNVCYVTHFHMPTTGCIVLSIKIFLPCYTVWKAVYKFFVLWICCLHDLYILCDWSHS